MRQLSPELSDKLVDQANSILEGMLSPTSTKSKMEIHEEEATYKAYWMGDSSLRLDILISYELKELVDDV